MTTLIFYNYSVAMDAELKALEDKIGQFVELCHRLRADNQQLRQELATAANKAKRLEEKINTATSRLETLLGQMPGDDET